MGFLENEDESNQPYRSEKSSIRLPKIEEEILGFWEKDDTFQASVDIREKGSQEFVFYDGPPFANGLPHYGHLLTGFVKDAIPRYQTMRGKRVERRFGWDCHGLPAEMATEKELGVTGRMEVIDFGIDKFNDHCRSLVQRTTDEWYRYVTRQARWVDFQDDYKTMDLDFMESVMWAFSRLHEKGLVYEGFRVLPYCWECETPLSNFETRQDDSYRARVDPAVTVAFQINADPSHEVEALREDFEVWAWTTTPWTLPSNLALAVGPEITYNLYRSDKRKRPFVIAAAATAKYAAFVEEATLVTSFVGSVLEGLSFTPIFNYFEGWSNAFKVLLGDFVATDEGTGTVQMAPGFGEDDQKLCESYSIATVAPVDDRARFVAPVTDYEGVQVFEANPAITQYLKEHDLLIETERYEHSYPHCWRTDTPLIYKAVSSWFVAVSSMRERLLEENAKINWTPSHVKDGSFGKWLEGARDWTLTRNRFWGAPIPVWKSDDPTYPRVDVYGSLDQIEADFGVRPKDLHRPYIDELTRPNPDDPTGKSKMVRVPDVLDCWFESGSMPYAQLHYPFERKSDFEDNFPADFIVEYIGQTRGWFYTLHVLGVALFDKPPFKNCMAHGILLGQDGRKLSKRLKNYPDPWDVFEEIGADAMRWFLLSSPVLRGQDAIVDRDSIVDALKRVINPIWNAYYFLTLYGNADKIKGEYVTTSDNILDRYILAKTSRLIANCQNAYDEYDLFQVSNEVEEFLEALTNWYIRRSRDRFWRETPFSKENDLDKVAAYNVLHSVLLLLTQVTAPMLPMLTEYIYKGLTGGRSVHLTDWPTENLPEANDDLVDAMDLVREACSQAHSIRKARGLRARLPLASLTIATENSAKLSPFVNLIMQETNVKAVELVDDPTSLARETITLVPRLLGPRLGGSTQSIINAAKAGDFFRNDEGEMIVGGTILYEGEYVATVDVSSPEASRSLFNNSAVVVLDIEPTAELIAEGTARDFIRSIQSMRKEENFNITDRIAVKAAVSTDSEHLAVMKHIEMIKAQTLSDEVDLAVDESLVEWTINLTRK